MKLHFPYSTHLKFTNFSYLAWGSILITINWGSYIFAVNSGHILDASLAYYLNPILVIILGAIFYGERLNHWQMLAAMLSTVGVLYSIFSYGKIPVFALVIGGSFALYGAVKKQVMVSSMVSTFMETALVFPLFLLVMIVLEVQGSGSIGHLAGWQYLLIPLAGVVTSVPLLVYAKGIQHTSLALSGILMYVNPTIQLLIGVFLYHEPFTQAQAVTFIFVWIAVLIFLGDSLLAGRRKRSNNFNCFLSCRNAFTLFHCLYKSSNNPQNTIEKVIRLAKIYKELTAVSCFQ